MSDKNKILTYNVKDSLFNSNVVLNVDYSDNVEDAEDHKVWKLFSEGDPDDRPTTRLENKWWDSLIGADSSGNQVPDIDLPVNRRYGTDLRPRQSWYVNRFNALKEIVDYGFSIKHFRNHSDLCLAGEDKSFIRKFMTKQGQSIFKPALASEIFSKDDFVK